MIYHMDVLLSGILYPVGTDLRESLPTNGIELSESELEKYQNRIDSLLHDIEHMEDAQDNGRILEGIESNSIICNKIETADISACKINGKLYCRIEIITKHSLTEYERNTFCSHVKRKFSNGWGNRYLKRLTHVDKGWLQIILKEPKTYIMEAQQKYEITDIPHSGYPQLRRIRALIDIGESVTEGDLGGYVQSEENLSQEGSCWLYNNAICCEDAVVSEDAELHDACVACGSALISGTAKMFDNTLADSNCVVHDGEIRFQARITGHAIIAKETESGMSPIIAGTSLIYGTVKGQYHVDDVVLPGETLCNPTNDLFILENGHRSVVREKNRSYFKEKTKKPNQKSSAER